jgi:putative CocE/NonD family hydrolase
MVRRALVVAGACVAVVAVAFAVLLALQPARPTAWVTRPQVAMRDGVRLAIDVILPDPMPAQRVPVVLVQTRYWRSLALRVGDPTGVPPIGPRDDSVDRLVAAGYGVVVADVRGTGASEGAWPRPWSDAEVADARELIDWIAAQPFCDGRIGTSGLSYEGTTALLSATSKNPALKAVLAREVEWDLVDELIAPGGVRNVSFVASWGDAVASLDRDEVASFFPWSARLLARGVHPVDGDADEAGLRQIVAVRRIADIARDVANVRGGADSFAGVPAAEVGPSGHAAELAATGARVGLWGGWWDGATADAVLRADRAMPLAEAVIGPWTHEGDASASPFGARAGSTVDLADVVAFFDRNLKGDDAGTPRRRWWVAGAETWREATAWPATLPATRWLVDGGGLAGEEAPLDAAFEVDFSASTGTENRWMTGLLRPVRADDRAKAQGILAFVGPPLAEPLAVFGAPVFRCRVAPDGPDAALFVYLEADDAAGVRLLTEGVERIRDRPTEIRLRSIAFELAPGTRLRVSLAGADADTFERVPPAGPRRVALRAPCGLELPVVAPPADNGLSAG